MGAQVDGRIVFDRILRDIENRNGGGFALVWFGVDGSGDLGITSLVR